MKIVIDIPEKEFGINIDGKFKDFFYRLRAEIKSHLTTNTSLVCGAYELETIDMFLDAFDNAIPLPEHHGRLIDADKLPYEDIESVDGNTYMCVNAYDIEHASTIIEAEGSES